MKENNNKIILYPSNWLYNAGVVGFLRVVEKEIGDEKVNEILSEGINLKEFFEENYKIDDIEVLIPKALGILINYLYSNNKRKKEKNYERSKKEGVYKIKLKISKKQEIFERKLFLNFQNSQKEEEFLQKFLTIGDSFFVMKNKGYIQRKDWVEENKYTTFIRSIVDTYNEEKNFACFQCGRLFKKPDYIDEEFFNTMTNYSSGTAVNLAASIAEFSNSFWNMDKNVKICPLCSFISIHYTLGLTFFNEYYENKRRIREEIFINTPNLSLTWDLNKLILTLSARLKDIRKILGTTLLEWTLRKKILVGAWTLINVEVIIKKEIKEPNKKTEIIIDYFDLPYHITRILLDYDVASLIKRINEEKMFDLIVSGKFSEIEKANYFVLKSILKLKNNENISDNDPVTKYISEYKNLEHLKKVSKLLPELYAKILKILNQTKGGL